MAATTDLFLFILIRKCPKTNQTDMKLLILFNKDFNTKR